MIKTLASILRSRIFRWTLPLLVLGGCWRHGRVDGDLLVYTLPSGEAQGFGVNGGEITFVFSNISLGAGARGLTWQHARLEDWQYDRFRRWLIDNTPIDDEAFKGIRTPHGWQRFEWFHSHRDTFRIPGARLGYYTIPLWLPAIPVALWLLRRLLIDRRRWQRDGRRRRGECIRCRYDIRFSESRCPECGTLIEP